MSNICFKLPNSRTEQKNFIVHVKRYFKEYNDKIISLLGEKLKQQDIDKIICFEKGIINALGEYYKGNPADSFDTLSSNLNKFQNDISFIVASGKEKKDLYGTYTEFKKLYRVRYSEKYKLNKEEIFHIPLDKRFEKVTNQRYSINSYPCLYLSDSLYTCWNEYDQPNFDNLHCSLFQFVEPAKFLNLAIVDIESEINQYLDGSRNIKFDFLKKHLFTWPLAFVCTIKVFDRNQKSYPEYITPQLVMQWIRNSRDVFGIKYISTKINSKTDYTNKKFNYVLPVRGIKHTSQFRNKKDKFCYKLLEKLHFTEPVSWSSLVVNNPAFCLYPENVSKRRNYKISKFGLMESHLDKNLKKSKLIV